MKKFAAALAALALLLSACALAFEGEGYPAWNGSLVPGDALCADFAGERLRMDFDSSADYSNIAQGTIQACFYAFDATQRHYLELYLILPEDVRAGDVYRSGDGEPCAVTLYEASETDEVCYTAEGADDGSSFELTVERADFTDASVSVRGSFSARLCRYDGNRPTAEFLDVAEGCFDFTLPLSGRVFSPDSTQAPEATFPAVPEDTFPAEPEATFPSIPDVPFPTLPPNDFSAQPSPRSATPAFTLPPYYAEI